VEQAVDESEEMLQRKIIRKILDPAFIKHISS
jgi:hypothetical protein